MFLCPSNVDPFAIHDLTVDLTVGGLTTSIFALISASMRQENALLSERFLACGRCNLNLWGTLLNSVQLPYPRRGFQVLLAVFLSGGTANFSRLLFRCVSLTICTVYSILLVLSPWIEALETRPGMFLPRSASIIGVVEINADVTDTLEGSRQPTWNSPELAALPEAASCQFFARWSSFWGPSGHSWVDGLNTTVASLHWRAPPWRSL